MIRWQLREPSVQVPVPTEPFQVWSLADGREWIRFHRVEGGYLLRFPGFSDFAVAQDGRGVESRPVVGCSAETLHHLFQTQVWPLALSLQGKLVFHGSAVEIGGRAVAFLGPSQRGKSTLAAAFAQAAHPVLADDALWVERGKDGLQVHPAFPSLRLWEDSASALGFLAAPEALDPRLPAKCRLRAGEAVRHCDEARPLAAVFFLGNGNAGGPSLRPLGPSEALVELVGHAFLLDVEQPGVHAKHFERLSRLAQEPIYHSLDYPRRFEALPSVRQALLEHLGQHGGTA